MLQFPFASLLDTSFMFWVFFTSMHLSIRIQMAVRTLIRENADDPWENISFVLAGLPFSPAFGSGISEDGGMSSFFVASSSVCSSQHLQFHWSPGAVLAPERVVDGESELVSPEHGVSLTWIGRCGLHPSEVWQHISVTLNSFQSAPIWARRNSRVVLCS